MDRLWIGPAGPGEVWQENELSGDAYELRTAAGPPAAVTVAPLGSHPARCACASAYLSGASSPSGTVWCLIAAAAAVRVNGEALPAGARLLDDRDEILLGARRLVLSTERVARMERYVAGDRAIACPRCGGQLETGDPIVRCPRCRMAHHHEMVPGAVRAGDPDAGESCWLHDVTCAACKEQSTDLGRDRRWTPDEVAP